MKLPFRAAKNPEPQGRRRPAQANQRPQAFSYYAQRSVTDRADAPRQRMDPAAPPRTGRRGAAVAGSLKSRFGTIIALIVVVISVVHTMSLSPNLKVEPLGDSTNNYFLQDTTKYQATAQQLFKKSLLNRNKLTFNATVIENGMKAKYPELADVAITLPLVGTRPIMYIQPTQPAVVLQTTSAEAYVLDSNGTALLVADGQSTLEKLPQVHDQSGLRVTLGKPVLSGASVRFIQIVVHQLQAQHIPIGALTLPANSDELDVSIGGKPYFVKFNLAATDAAQQAGTFIAVQQKLSQQGITPASYIDVRVDGRAYYK